jgi:GNAT superfamily N-acetyltransferase
VEFETRTARQSDYDGAAELCRRAVGRNDYVLPILKRLISSGGLFLALDGTRIIGITNYKKLLDDSGWISSARTDPDYRGKRVAGLLQRAIAAKARKDGADTLRMWINKTNTPSIRAATRGGFKPVAEMIHESKNVGKIAKIKIERFEDPTLQEIKEILNSNYLRQMNGYFACNWWLAKASEKVIRSIAKVGELYKSNEGVFYLPEEHEIWGTRQHNEFAPLSGYLNNLLAAIEKFVPVTGARSTGSFFPYNRHYMQVARERGYKAEDWGNHCVLFEKRITRA